MTISTEKFFCVFIFFLLFILSAIRPFDVGTDTLDYVQGFVNPSLSIQNRNLGYNYFVELIRIFTDDPRVYLIIVSFIVQGFIIKSIINNSNSPLFATIIYSLMFYCLSLNLLRQFIVIGAFYHFGCYYIFKRNLLMYTLLIITLYTIHELSLVFIPFYFLSKNLLPKIFYIVIWAISFIFLLVSELSYFESYFENLNVFLKLINNNLPNYFSEIDSLTIKNVSMNGVYLDQLLFILLFYTVFYVKKTKPNFVIVLFFNIFFMGIVLQNILFFVQVIQRIPLMFLFANVYLVSSLDLKYSFRAAYIIILFLLFYVRFVINGTGGVFIN